MRYMWKRVSPREAEDLTQQVFTRVYQSVRKGGGPSEADEVGWRRYLFSCARNETIDFWRRRGARIAADCLTDLVGDEHSWQEYAVSSDSPSGSGVSQEHSRAIRDCMGELDTAPRAMCWLVFVENRSKREVAKLMSMPESSLRSALVEAVGRLRLCLSGKGVLPDGCHQE